MRVREPEPDRRKPLWRILNALEAYKHLVGYHGMPDQHSLSRSTV